MPFRPESPFNPRMGSFSVRPNPVLAGESVEVTGDPGDTLFILYPDGTKDSITLDKNGKATVRDPVGPGKVFTVTDADPKNPQEVDVDVVQNKGKN